MKRIAVLLLVLLGISAFTILTAVRGGPVLSMSAVVDGSYFRALDIHLSNRLPGHNYLRQAGLRMGLLGGQWEQNDIFISSEGLLRNIDAPDNAVIQQNIDSLLRFVDYAEIPTYVMLLPTSSAILQEYLPPYAELYNNQKQMIEDIYRQLAGRVTVVDVYNTLFGLRDEYIYYRTENNLTALGGYHVYSVLGQKLVQEVQDFSQFEIEYLPGTFYGDLYQQSPYQEIPADHLSLMHYTRFAREYLVTHRDGDGIKQYHTLYPRHLRELTRDMDVYLGGISPVTDLRISSPYLRSLLVLGDHTALSYLPYLANNYQEITLVDLSSVTPELVSGLNIREYDQILFAYSVETFNTPVVAALDNLF